MNVIPGVPVAGHFSRGGYWHPGDHARCQACHPIKNRETKKR
jgi:hypothetical protein